MPPGGCWALDRPDPAGGRAGRLPAGRHRRGITNQPGVASVPDVHVWLITSGFPALSTHVLVRRPADCHQVRRELEQLLCGRFGLDHTTLQVDHAPDDLLTIGRPAPAHTLARARPPPSC